MEKTLQMDKCAKKINADEKTKLKLILLAVSIEPHVRENVIKTGRTRDK